jgi:hypothetical protein
MASAVPFSAYLISTAASALANASGLLHYTDPAALGVSNSNEITDVTFNDVKSHTGYGELCTRAGNTTVGSWPSLGALGSPSGKGALYEATQLSGRTIAAGTWTVNQRFGWSLSNTVTSVNATLTGTLYCRIYKYNGSTYTALGTLSKSISWTSPSPGTATTQGTETLTGSLSAASFTSSDKLYLDFWLNIATNQGNAGGVIYVELADQGFLVGGSFNQVTTPGYTVSGATGGTRVLSGNTVALDRLTLGFSNIASTTLPTALGLTTTFNTNGTEKRINKSPTQVGGLYPVRSGSSGWDEMCANAAAGGANPWRGLSQPGAPSGYGLLFDSSELEGKVIGAGRWRINCFMSPVYSGSSVSMTFEMIARFWLYDTETGGYTPLGEGGTSLLAASSVLSTTIDASLPAVYVPVGSRIYMDWWVRIAANGLASGNSMAFRTSVGGVSGSTLACSAPDYSVTLPGVVTGTVVDLSLYASPQSARLTGDLWATDTLAGAPVSSTIPVGTATGYGELPTFVEPSVTVWPASGSLGAPSGDGVLAPLTTIAGRTLRAGTYTVAYALQCSATSGLTGTLYHRFYAYNVVGDSYTLIGTLSQAVTLSNTTGGVVRGQFAGELAGYTFSSDESLYVDFWLNITSNTTGSGATTVALLTAASSALGTGTGDGNPHFVITTPGWVASGATGGTRVVAGVTAALDQTSLYVTTTAATTVATARTLVGGKTVAGRATRPGGGATYTMASTSSGWQELTFNPSTVATWASAAGTSTPTGNGALLDSTVLGGHSLSIGSYPVHLRLGAGGPSGFLLHVTARLYKRSSGGVYTLIGSGTTSNLDCSSATRSLVVPVAVGSTVAFASTDRLYLDLWGQIGQNTLASGNTFQITTYASLDPTQGSTLAMIDLLPYAVNTPSPRTVGATAALKATPTRTAIATTAIKSLDLMRTLSSVRVSLGGATRSVGATAAFSAADITRTLSTNRAVLLATLTRTVTPATLAVKSLDLARTIASATAALSAAPQRVVLATGALSAPDLARTIGTVRAPLLATPTRTVTGVTTAIKQLDITRTLGATAALTGPRAVPATTALQSVNVVRTVSATECSALVYPGPHGEPHEHAAPLYPGTRTLGVTVALQGVNVARTVSGATLVLWTPTSPAPSPQRRP